jgi:titin
VTLSWTTTDATTVNIDQGVGSVGTSGSTVIMPTATTTYTLTAGGVGGTATKSVTVSVTYGYAPASPDSLTATAVSGTQIDLKWADKSGDEDGLTIERSTLQDFSGQISTVRVGTNTTSYSDPQLSASTTYYYRVLAFNSAGSSGFSNTAVVTTTATAPAAPTNLTATVMSSSQVDLKWNDNSANEEKFIIERSAYDTFSVLVSFEVGKGVTTFQNTGLTKSTKYFYRVRAGNSVGTSAPSNSASVRTKSR